MKLTLIKKLDEARGTKSFFFKSEEKLVWTSGQYIYITLPHLNYEDERGATRHFTISSSPTEGDLVRITVRIRQESGYKKTLDELPIGTVVEGKSPQGFFGISELDKDHNHIFLAGGIGITPFRSMIKYMIDSNLKIPVHLVFSNSSSDFVFKNELDSWKEKSEFLKITYFDTSINKHLDIKKLEAILSNNVIKNLTYWVVGPNVFVNAMEEILAQMKIKEDDIKSEKFTGY